MGKRMSKRTAEIENNSVERKPKQANKQANDNNNNRRT